MYTKYDKVALVQFYPNTGLILINNYTSENFARQQKDRFTVGIWKAKCVHNWKTNLKEQYQKCTKCGEGHAL